VFDTATRSDRGVLRLNVMTIAQLMW